LPPAGRGLDTELERARAPSEQAAGRLPALVAVAVPGVRNLTLLESEPALAVARSHVQRARDAVQRQELSEIEQRDEPELAHEDGSCAHRRTPARSIAPHDMLTPR